MSSSKSNFYLDVGSLLRSVMKFVEKRKSVEHKFAVNTTAEALRFLQNHPEYEADYQKWIDLLDHHHHMSMHGHGTVPSNHTAMVL